MEKETEGKTALTTYEYGAGSSKFRLFADNKLTAYAAMILHYGDNAGVLVLYAPESKVPEWSIFNGSDVAERVDKVFGGPGEFLNYIEMNKPEIEKCYNTIERLV